MLYRLALLLFSASLFAQSAPSAYPLANTAPNVANAFFLIDPMQRGKDIVSMITTLTSPALTNTRGKVNMQVAIQTMRNGLITGVFDVDFAKNYTILIVKYSGPYYAQYIVVPVEQIIEVVYSSTAVVSTQGNFTATSTTGVLPYFNVDITQRAEDIVEIVNKLMDPADVYYTPNKTQIGIQTMLTGPYYAQPSNANSAISNVKGVSVNGSSYGTLLLFSYEVSNNQIPRYFIAVPTEQIYGITSSYNLLKGNR